MFEKLPPQKVVYTFCRGVNSNRAASSLLLLILGPKLLFFSNFQDAVLGKKNKNTKGRLPGAWLGSRPGPTASDPAIFLPRRENRGFFLVFDGRLGRNLRGTQNSPGVEPAPRLWNRSPFCLGCRWSLLLGPLSSGLQMSV